MFCWPVLAGAESGLSCALPVLDQPGCTRVVRPQPCCPAIRCNAWRKCLAACFFSPLRTSVRQSPNYADISVRPRTRARFRSLNKSRSTFALLTEHGRYSAILIEISGVVCPITIFDEMVAPALAAVNRASDSKAIGPSHQHSLIAMRAGLAFRS